VVLVEDVGLPQQELQIASFLVHPHGNSNVAVADRERTCAVAGPRRVCPGDIRSACDVCPGRQRCRCGEPSSQQEQHKAHDAGQRCHGDRVEGTLKSRGSGWGAVLARRLRAEDPRRRASGGSLYCE
jgi:hypothetical protein